MATQHQQDCVAHAVQLAKLLSTDGAEPWIGRIRDLVITVEHTISHPLIPIRFAGIGRPQWSTHYVCCESQLAYDPLVGEPIAIDELALRVFGRTLPIEEVVPASKVKALLADDSLRPWIHGLGRAEGPPAAGATGPRLRA